MVARRLEADIPHCEGDLRPVADLVDENVQEQLAGRHGDALPANVELANARRSVFA